MGNSRSKKKQKKESTTAVTASTTNESNNNTTKPAETLSKRKDSKKRSAPPSRTASKVKKEEKGSKAKRNQKESNSEDFNAKKLEKLFEKYKDPEEEEQLIGPDGICKFCDDLGVKPEDVVVLVIAYYLKAEEMGYFKKDEFIEGFTKLRVDSCDKIKSKFPKFEEDLKDENTFKEIYKFAFYFSREDLDKKVIDLDVADGMLGMLLGDQPHVKYFRRFLHKQTTYKGINADQWMSFLEFSRTIEPDFSGYDENGAWPVLIDLYVDWFKEGKDLEESADGKDGKGDGKDEEDKENDGEENDGKDNEGDADDESSSG